MLNKNDPLIGAVQEVMKKNQAEREAVRLVNEKFGVSDRKALPHEKQGEWDAAYKSVLTEGLHPNQQKLDVHEPEKDKLTAQDFKMLRAKKKTMEESDVTSPSSMGIKKPDYASGTPDYANKGPQMVNRAAKTSMPAGTVNKSLKEAVMNKVMKKLEEKKMTDAEMAKREEIVKSMKKGMPGFKKRYGKRAKDVMYATATKQAMKEEKEGFNSRHGLSVTASAEKQAVADQLNEKVGNPLLLNRAKARARLGDSGVRRPISGTNNLQTRLANMRKSSPALDANRNQNLDQPTTQSPMAIAQKRQDMASDARQNRAGTNTFVPAARAEAERRRRAGEPVLKAADVPGINASQKSIDAAQSKSDEVMAASKMANRNDLAQKAKDLRAGTNTFVAKPKKEYQVPFGTSDKTPEERAKQAKDTIARLNDKKPPGSETSAAATASKDVNDRDKMYDAKTSTSPSLFTTSTLNQKRLQAVRRPVATASTPAKTGPSDALNAPSRITAPTPSVTTATPAATASTPPAATASQTQVAPAATQTAPVRKASTMGGTMTQRDADLMARAKAGGGQALSKTFSSGSDRLAYLQARAKANK